MKKVLLLVFVVSVTLYAQVKDEFTIKPFGYVRAWSVNQFSENTHEFKVKMARAGVKGDVNKYASYKVFVDFARIGSLNKKTTVIDGQTVVSDVSADFSDVLLDAVATIKPVKGLSFNAGQFKVPFSTDNLRSAASTDFVNRPFLVKVSPGLRDVGFTTEYKFDFETPFTVTGGLFNGAGQNNEENDKTVNYSLRSTIAVLNSLGISLNYYGGKLAGKDVNIYGAGVDYSVGDFFFSGEYGDRETSSPGADFGAGSWFLYGVYTINTGSEFLNAVQPAVRFESYDPDDSFDNDEVSRVTAGLSFQFAKTDYARLRINYEYYDYADDRESPNTLIVELMTRF